MTDRSKAADTSRRDVLRLGGLGAVAAGAATLGAVTAAEAVEVKPATGEYRETAHVKTYYQSARF